MGESVSSRSRANYPETFNTFMKVYPRRVGKASAFRRWKPAEKLVGADALIAGAVLYAEHIKRNRIEPQFVMYPERWLNGGHWDDEYPVAPSMISGPELNSPEWHALQDEELRRLREEEDGV